MAAPSPILGKILLTFFGYLFHNPRNRIPKIHLSPLNNKVDIEGTGIECTRKWRQNSLSLRISMQRDFDILTSFLSGKNSSTVSYSSKVMVDRFNLFFYHRFR